MGTTPMHPRTLLSAAAATGSAVSIVAANYMWNVWGTWDGATAQLQYSPDGGTTWADIDGAVATADGGALNAALGSGHTRVSISGAGASTSLSSDLRGSI